MIYSLTNPLIDTVSLQFETDETKDPKTLFTRDLDVSFYASL